MSLSLSAVTKVFELRGRPPHVAVDDVTLEVEQGSFCTLLGPSGCGKTTLLRLIAGFEQPTRGDIVHNGTSILRVPPYRRGFPMVFQSYALFPHMTVAGNVGYGLQVRKVPRSQRAERIRRALSLLGLDELRDRHPAQLSGGQQQRVALARALVLEPELILLDEPLSNLDAALRVAMRAEIRALQRRLGITALYVTHDQEEALAISDRVVVMDRGRIEQIGSPQEVYQRPTSEFVARFMGSPNVLPIRHLASGDVELLGERYPVHDVASAAALAVIRSDAIVVSESGRHRATVADTTFLGSRTVYRLRLEDGTMLLVDRPAGDALTAASGAAIAFDLRLDRLHYL